MYHGQQMADTLWKFNLKSFDDESYSVLEDEEKHMAISSSSLGKTFLLAQDWDKQKANQES